MKQKKLKGKRKKLPGRNRVAFVGGNPAGGLLLNGVFLASDVSDAIEVKYATQEDSYALAAAGPDGFFERLAKFLQGPMLVAIVVIRQREDFIYIGYAHLLVDKLYGKACPCPAATYEHNNVDNGHWIC